MDQEQSNRAMISLHEARSYATTAARCSSLIFYLLSFISYGAHALLLCTGCAPQATNEVAQGVKLPSVLPDGMVLQRHQPITIWGTAPAGTTVRVSLQEATTESAAGTAAEATADAGGNWSVTLPPLPAGGPYELHVNDITLSDILVGDVWLCSGQSNMELPVSRVMDMFADEVLSYENTQIRQFLVPKVTHFQAPQSDVLPTEWKPCTQANVMDFSALAYFFAKEMYAQTGVPVGILCSAWGGTPVESWISEEGLHDYPLYLNTKRLYEDDAYRAHLQQMAEENNARWAATLQASDPGLHESTPWYAADYDDSHWREVDMFSPRDWGNNGLNPQAGSHWLRRSVTLPDDWAGHEATLRLGCIVDADSVYVNGTFVGGVTYQYPPRIYPIPAGLLKGGENNVTVRIISYGQQPSFVREKAYKIICGTEEVSLEGLWRYHQGAEMPGSLGSVTFAYQPVCLYNAMIAPLTRLRVSGAIWYQGESNVSRRNEYADLLTTMIADWRRAFNDPQMPFYIVELADYLHPSDVGGRRAWAEMRAVQAQAAERNDATWLIPNSDLGEWNDIHPLDKKTLGHRVVSKVVETQAKTAPLVNDE